MTRLAAAFLLAGLLSSQAVLAQQAKCSRSQKCPEEAPCCSPYGDCGIGAYCLGGCDPFSSFSIESCVPAPICEGKTYRWDNLDSVIPNTRYLGDAGKHDWLSSGQPLSADGNLILTMAPDTVGTLMSHNHYMWYGKASARLKTSRGAGVVTAFILMSDVKDEIDFEFIGVDLVNAQTNYYHQGITDYTNGANASVSNTFTTYHTYEIDWKPESITWSIDGKPVRVKKREETYDEKKKMYSFPQTPSRVQLSLWPAGLPSNGEGTVEWAGGLVDWEHEDPKNHGYYYAMFDEIKVECYDPPSNAKITGDKSYIYTDNSGLEGSVEISDRNTVLKSLRGSGTDMDEEYPSSSGSDGPVETEEVPVIPGLSGAGPGANGQRGDDGTGNNGEPWDPNAPGANDFSQGDGDGGNSNAAPAQTEKVLAGSVFAVLVAVLALVTL